jgi:hypothetical protein
MKNTTNNKKLGPEYQWKKIPEILYEESGNPIPYIEVPKEMKMPPLVFIFEYHLTGEYEPDDKGNPAEIVDQTPHQYVDMQFLTERLKDSKTMDKVREALGMEPLEEAKKKGGELLNKLFHSTDTLKKANQ